MMQVLVVRLCSSYTNKAIIVFTVGNVNQNGQSSNLATRGLHLSKATQHAAAGD